MDHQRSDRKQDFKYHARNARIRAVSNVRNKSYVDESGADPLTALAKEFDPKLYEKITKVNAAHRDLDQYVIDAFKEAEGDGTTKR